MSKSGVRWAVIASHWAWHGLNNHVMRYSGTALLRRKEEAAKIEGNEIEELRSRILTCCFWGMTLFPERHSNGQWRYMSTYYVTV